MKGIIILLFVFSFSYANSCYNGADSCVEVKGFKKFIENHQANRMEPDKEDKYLSLKLMNSFSFFQVLKKYEKKDMNFSDLVINFKFKSPKVDDDKNKILDYMFNQIKENKLLSLELLNGYKIIVFMYDEFGFYYYNPYERIIKNENIKKIMNGEVFTDLIYIRDDSSNNTKNFKNETIVITPKDIIDVDPKILYNVKEEFKKDIILEIKKKKGEYD